MCSATGKKCSPSEKEKEKEKERPRKNAGAGGNKWSLRRRCVCAVKEQRAKLYLIRRCVTMLLCWHKYEDA